MIPNVLAPQFLHNVVTQPDLDYKSIMLNIALDCIFPPCKAPGAGYYS